MPLPIAPAGEELTVKKVFTVVSQVGGNVILKVREGRLALDRTQAMKILV